ncbi:hypothetical protein [Brevundimonas sp. TWP2-3-4b2]|uniref:hypothetical protein n=1 Tax=Brevundimonas sp. TWP2-3-4b2 TaxID=2804595 RepID=UPI003CECD167
MGQDDNHWCALGFAEPAVVFKGPTRTARSVTEAWVALHGFCPNRAADRLPQLIPSFRHPLARRFSAATGGPSGAREREPIADAAVRHRA